MVLQNFISAFFSAIPLIRKGWRWLLERNLEVTIKEHFEDMSKPYNISAPDLATGRPGGVYSLLDLQLINHRVDRPERIIECWAELRRRHLLFWHTTLAKIPVLTSSSNNWQLETPIKDIYLEPMSKPQNYVINIIGDFNNVKIPRHFELVVVFRMVGPIRKYIHKLTNVRHDQKRVADEEGQS